MIPAPSSANSYDVVILGGGPAGTATALSLKRRDPSCRVALVERSDYSSLRVGESLPPPAQALLRKLGVWETFLQHSPLESAGTRAAWGSPEMHENEFIFSPFGRGWHLDRRDFDSMLAREAERAGVSVFRRTQARLIDHSAPWNIHLQEGDDASASRTITARFIVDATGRRSSFARSQGAIPLVFDHLVGVVVFLKFAPEDRLLDTYTAVEACEQGWWYTAVLPCGDMAAIFMTDAALLGSMPWRTLDDWRTLTAMGPQTSKRIAKGQPLAKPSLHLAESRRLESCVGNDWLAVGDAACTLDPLSSQGVMKGLQSGIDASLAILSHLNGSSEALAVYDRQIAENYSRYLDGRAAYYGLEQRWPNSPFWKSRHEVVTLHPDEHLCVVSADAVSNPLKLSTRLSASELTVLAQTCIQPRAAHQVLAEFKARSPRPCSDREVLLAMQALLAGGILSRN